MKRRFLLFVLVSILFFSACADAKDMQGEGNSHISATGMPEIQPSATGALIPQPSATETPTPQPTATNTPTPQPPTEEELAKERVTQKIWEAFEKVRYDKEAKEEGRFWELLLESRGTLHIAMITYKPVIKIENNIYQGEGLVYLVFYDESKDEAPHFVCKYGSMFEADIFGDGGKMYLSLITNHEFSGAEFYDMSAFCLSQNGCFEAVFAENSLAYWQDRKAEFEEGGKVKIYQRIIRRAFFYPYLLNEIDAKNYSWYPPDYDWEHETDLSLSQLVFDRPSSVRVLNESTVLADLLSPECERYIVWPENDWVGEDKYVVAAGSLMAQDGSVLTVYKELIYSKWECVNIMLYDKDGNLLDHMHYTGQVARIMRDTAQNCFEIHAWEASQGWEEVGLSGRVRAENGKIVIEPDEEQGKTYVPDFSEWPIE